MGVPLRNLRIWKVDGTGNRTASDFIASGQEYTAAELGLTASNPLTLYVEALRPSETLADQQIKVLVALDGGGYTVHDEVRVTAIQAIDLDVDSDNSGGLYDDPQGDAAEDDAEKTASGAKLLIVSRDDSDSDGILDFADGYGRFGDTAGTDGEQFAHAKLRIPAMPESMRSSVRLVFSYSAAALVDTRTTTTTQALDGEWYNHSSYSTGTGLLRLWKKDAYEARTDGDFIESGREYTLAELGISASDMDLFIEAVNGSATSIEIGVTLRLYGNVSSTDTVRVLPLDPEVGIDGSQELTGYHIFRGNGSSVMGSPDKDILIGTSSGERIEGLGGDDVILSGQNAWHAVDAVDDSDDMSGDTITGGEGADVIFSWFGNNSILLDSSDEIARGDQTSAYFGSHDSPPGAQGAAYAAPMQAAAAAAEAKTVPTFTGDDIEAAYKWMYGEDDIWLRGFKELGGQVLAVKADGHWLSDWSIDWKQTQTFGAYVGYDVKIEYDIGSALTAASALREAIMKTAWRDSFRWTQFFQGGAGENIVDLVRYGEALEAWTAHRSQNFEYAKETARLATELYVNGMTLAFGAVGDVADVVIAMPDAAQGDLGAMLAMLPLVPGVVRQAGRARALVNLGFEKFIMKGDVLFREGSTLGFVLRYDLFDAAQKVLPKIERIPTPNGKTTWLIGTAQEVAGTTHAATVARKATELAQSGNYAHVTMARSWRTATGRASGEATSSLIPDIIAVRWDGKVEVFEVRSAGQTDEYLLGKMNEGMNTIPQQHRTAIDPANILELD